jgi:hypothetical protein
MQIVVVGRSIIDSGRKDSNRPLLPITPLFILPKMRGKNTKVEIDFSAQFIDNRSKGGIFGG